MIMATLNYDEEHFAVRLSADEQVIEQKRIYTHSARALHAAMLDRGPAGSPDFWASVKALHDVSKAYFLPHFIVNRIRLISRETRWEWEISQGPSYSVSAPSDEIDNKIDAQKNFCDIATQIRSPVF